MVLPPPDPAAAPCLTCRRRAQASAPGNAPPADATPEQLERAFWRGVTLNPPLYGADVAGSLFEERQGPPGWNLRRLSSLLSRTLNAHGHSVPGVTSPYLYFGSWRAFFAWHTEDLDLHSVNYLHCGAGKTWYVVPPAHRARFEQLVRGMLPEFFAACPEFMRHKVRRGGGGALWRGGGAAGEDVGGVCLGGKERRCLCCRGEEGREAGARAAPASSLPMPAPDHTPPPACPPAP